MKAFEIEKSEVPSKWGCLECDAEYNDEQEAEECCRETFYCKVCDHSWMTEDEAIECCQDEV